MSLPLIKKMPSLFWLSILLLVFYMLKQKEPIPDKFCVKKDARNEGLYSTSPYVSEMEREYTFEYGRLFKCFNLNATSFFDMPFVSILRGEKSIFQSVAQHVFSDINNKKLESKNVKCGDIVYVQTEKLKIFKEEFHPKIKYPYILITHESDLSVGNEQWHIKFVNDPKIIRWYTMNIAGQHSKLKPIPLGIIPPSRESFPILLNLSKSLIPNSKRHHLLYLNFSPNTNKNRSKVEEYFKKTFKNNSRVIVEKRRIVWNKYLLKIANSQFVLSPPGAGLDCHRTWEALSLGAYPIVLNNSLLPIYDDLPVMIVNEWKDVTESKMYHFQRDMSSKLSKDGVAWKTKFWLRYWISEIMLDKNRHVNKYC